MFGNRALSTCTVVRVSVAVLGRKVWVTVQLCAISAALAVGACRDLKYKSQYQSHFPSLYARNGTPVLGFVFWEILMFIDFKNQR